MSPSGPRPPAQAVRLPRPLRRRRLVLLRLRLASAFGHRDAHLLWEGSVRYEDTTGASGLLPAGGVEWFKAAGGAWHGGGAGNSGRSRGFQLWLALRADQELGPSESIYLTPASPASGRSRSCSAPTGAPSRSRRRPRSIISPSASRPARPGATSRRRSRRCLDRAGLGEPRVPEPVQRRARRIRGIRQAIDFRAERHRVRPGSAASHPYELALGTTRCTPAGQRSKLLNGISWKFARVWEAKESSSAHCDARRRPTPPSAASPTSSCGRQVNN